MFRFIVPTLALVLAGCATVDEERQDLYDATADASLLAREIDSWTQDLQRAPRVPQTAMETARSFQDRAEEICESLEDVPVNARAGVDVSGLAQSLREVESFEVDRIEEASQEARVNLLQQFQSLASNVRSAARQVATELS